MKWQALLRLPDDAGAAIDALGKRLGVERAVAARIIIMQWYEGQQGQELGPSATGAAGVNGGTGDGR